MAPAYNPFKPASYAYEPQTTIRARQASAVQAMAERISPLVAAGDPVSIQTARQIVRDSRAPSPAVQQAQAARRQATGEAFRSIANPPEAGAAGPDRPSFLGNVANAFRSLVPREVRDGLATGFGAATSASAFADLILPGDPGTAVKNAIERVPVIGTPLAVGLDAGLSPLSLASAGIGSTAAGGAALARLGASGVAGRVGAALIAPAVQGGIASNVAAQGVMGIGGHYGAQAASAATEALGGGETAQAVAGLAGGLAGGVAGLHGINATRSVWRATARQQAQEAMRAAAPEAFEQGRTAGQDLINPHYSTGGQAFPVPRAEDLGNVANVDNYLAARIPADELATLREFERRQLAGDIFAAERTAREARRQLARPNVSRETLQPFPISGGAMRATPEQAADTVTLYRGDKQPVENLSLSRAGTRTKMGQGLYFTDDRGAAATHAMPEGSALASIPGLDRFGKPQTLEQAWGEFYDEMATKIRSEGYAETEHPVRALMAASKSREEFDAGLRRMAEERYPRSSVKVLETDEGWMFTRADRTGDVSRIDVPRSALDATIQPMLALSPETTQRLLDALPENGRVIAQRYVGENLRPTYNQLVAAFQRDLGDRGQVMLRRGLSDAGVTGIKYPYGSGLGYVFWDEQAIQRLQRGLPLKAPRAAGLDTPIGGGSPDQPREPLMRGGQAAEVQRLQAQAQREVAETGAVSEETKKQLMEAFGRSIGATTPEQQAAAREALYNGPVPTDMREVDTGLIEGFRAKLGAPTTGTVEDALSRARQAEISPDEAARQARAAAREAKFERFRAGLRRMNEPSTGAALSKDPAKLAAAARELNSTLDDDLETLMARFDTQGPTLDNRNRADQLFRRVTGGAEEADAQIRAVNSSSDLRAQFDRFRAQYGTTPARGAGDAAGVDDPFAVFDRPAAPGELPDARPAPIAKDRLAKIREEAMRRFQEQQARGEEPPPAGLRGGAPDQPAEPFMQGQQPRPVDAEAVAASHTIAPGDAGRLPLEQIRTRPELFQARDTTPGTSFDERKVQNLVENWSPDRVDPLVVAPDPEGGYVVLSGHHRLEAARRVGAEDLPVRVVNADLTTNAGMNRAQTEAILGNFGQAEQNVRERVRAFSTLADHGMSVDEIGAQARMSAEKVQRTIDVGHAGAAIVDRVTANPQLEGVAAEVGRFRRMFGVSEEDAQGTFDALVRRGKGETLPSPTAVRRMLDRLAPAFENRQLPGFEGNGFGGDSTPLYQAVREGAKLQDELLAAQRRINREIASVKSLGERAGVDVSQLEAAGQTELASINQRLGSIESEVMSRVRTQAETAAPRTAGQATLGEIAQQEPIQDGPSLFDAAGMEPPRGGPPVAEAAPSPEEPRGMSRREARQTELERLREAAARMERGILTNDANVRAETAARNAEAIARQSRELPIQAEPGPLPSGRGPQQIRREAQQAWMQNRESGMIDAASDYGHQPGLFAPEPPERGVARVASLFQQLRADPKRTILDLLNAPRSLMASGDLSYSLRQNAMLAPNHPKAWLQSMKDQLAGWRSVEGAQAVTDRIVGHPLYPYLKKMGVEILEQGGHQDEAYLSKIVADLPLQARSARAATAAGNSMRAGVAYDWLTSFTPEQLARMPQGRLEAMGEFINAATGRGRLPDVLQTHAQALNALFFAPRNLIGKVQANLAVFSRDAEVRKEAAKSLAAFYGTGIGILALAKLGGANVGITPTSSDFGKITLPGGTRIDIWGGNQQLFRFVANIVTGEATSARTGQTYDQARGETVYRFLKSKLAPVPAAVVAGAQGESPSGEQLRFSPPAVGEQALRMVTPLFIQELVDATRGAGPVEGLVAGVGSAIGLGTQAYEQGAGDQLARQAFGKQYGELSAQQRNELAAAHPDLQGKILEEQAQAGGRGGQAAAFRQQAYQQQLASDQQLLEGKLTRQDWQQQRGDRTVRLRGQLEAVYGPGQAITDAQAAKDPLKRYLKAIADSTDPSTGAVDQGALERARAGWDQATNEAIDKSLGTSDTPLVRAYRKAANVYYELPRYQGYTADEARAIDELWSRARANAASTDDLAMSRALRQVLAQAGDVDPRIVTGVRRRIAGSLSTAPDRKRATRRDPLTAYFFGTPTPQQRAQAEQQLQQMRSEAA